MPSTALYTTKCHKIYGQEAELSLSLSLSLCIKAVIFYVEVLSKKCSAVLSLSQNATKRLCFHHGKASSSETSVHFREHGIASQKPAIFVVTPVRIPNIKNKAYSYKGRRTGGFLRVSCAKNKIFLTLPGFPFPTRKVNISWDVKGECQPPRGGEVPPSCSHHGRSGTGRSHIPHSIIPHYHQDLRTKKACDQTHSRN